MKHLNTSGKTTANPLQYSILDTTAIPNLKPLSNTLGKIIIKIFIYFIN